MLTAYLDAALRRARYEWLDEDRVWYAEIPDLPGVLATQDTVEATRAELRDVVEDWIVLALRRGRELPVLDGMNLTPKLDAA